MANLLSVHNLRLPTGQLISLHIARGEVHSLNGPSGVGKTRLLRALTDLDDAEGQIRLHHQPVGNFTAMDWRRQVMLVPAESRWWLETAGAHMDKDMHQEAEQLQLDPARLSAPLHQLSTGEKARCALLRALSYEPQVLLLDEPTAALDPDSAQCVEALVTHYARRRAVLWVTHDTQQAQRVADHHWLLSTDGFTRTH